MRSISGTLDSQGEVLRSVKDKVDEVGKRVDLLDQHLASTRRTSDK